MTEDPCSPTRNVALIALFSTALAIAIVVGAVGGYLVGGGWERLAVAEVAANEPSRSTPSANSVAPDPNVPTVDPNPSGALDVASVTAKVRPGIVDINTVLAFNGSAAAGTGMILTAGGEILTNNHVVSGATRITVTVVATGHEYEANVVGTDKTADVAVLQLVGASKLDTIPIGDSSRVTAGQSVLAIGNALGKGGEPTVSTGTVEAIGQTITASDGSGRDAERLHDLIQINAPIQPGDSGGALANAAGNVIGMNTAASAGNRFASASTTGLAIPIKGALDIVHQIESGKGSAEVRIGLPGIIGVQVDDTVTATGVPVAGVARGLPAEAAGIQAGDSIVSVNGAAVESTATLNTALRAHAPGDDVEIGWVGADGAKHEQTIELVAGPAD